MGKLKLKGYTVLLIIASVLIYSCSKDDILPDENNNNSEATNIFLSILVGGDDQTKSSGTYEGYESKVHSLAVLVFRSSSETEAGKLDGSKMLNRIVDNTTNEYQVIQEIKDIKVTAGKRDIYVIANAPDNYFTGVKDLTGFLAKYENLSTQAGIIYEGATTTPSEDSPIGGLKPKSVETNLTMCNFIQGVTLSKYDSKQYLGYNTSNGLPSGVSSGYVITKEAFNVERLAARIAVKEIKFDLNAALELETGYSTSSYTYQIDSVFMMNVRTNSKFPNDANLATGFTPSFGHGSKFALDFLSSTYTKLKKDAVSFNNTFCEPITAPSYNIEQTSNNSTPIWFYAFENGGTNPTYLVVGARFNYLAKDGTRKSVKSYYPIEINRVQSGKTANHDYIKRNNQYFISITIKGVGNIGKPVVLKNGTLDHSNDVLVTEMVGPNLFPWVGDIYK